MRVVFDTNVVASASGFGGNRLDARMEGFQILATTNDRAYLPSSGMVQRVARTR
jgi:hypothetical protein